MLSFSLPRRGFNEFSLEFLQTLQLVPQHCWRPSVKYYFTFASLLHVSLLCSLISRVLVLRTSHRHASNCFYDGGNGVLCDVFPHFRLFNRHSRCCIHEMKVKPNLFRFFDGKLTIHSTRSFNQFVMIARFRIFSIFISNYYRAIFELAKLQWFPFPFNKLISSVRRSKNFFSLFNFNVSGFIHKFNCTFKI